MPSRDYDSDFPQATLTNTAAFYVIRRALEKFLRQREPSFLAVLKVPVHDDLLIYRDAAKRLLYADVLDIFDVVDGGSVRDDNYVAAVWDFEKSVVQSSLKGSAARKRSILVAPTFDRITKELRLAADILAEIPTPTPSDFIEAADEIRLTGMTRKIAQYLCQLPFDDIDMAMREGRSLDNVVARLKAEDKRAAVATLPEPEVTAPKGKTLAQLEGYGEVKQWGLQLATDLAEWMDGAIEWSDVDSGALISGPPGSGKTTFAAALANTCGASLVTTSAAKWQSKGHLGDYLKAMRSSFAEARAKMPCILFIDEFDSVGDRDGPGDDEHRDYRRQTINGLLECIDGADGREGVVVVGATNDRGQIDAALLRPGRLERHLEVPYPDEGARVAILLQHLKVGVVQGDLSQFIKVSDGWTGAAIADVAKNARRIARRRKTAISVDVVMQAMPDLRRLPPAMLNRVAVHEAGHAIVGTVLSTGTLEQVYINEHFVEGQQVQSLGKASFVSGNEQPQTADFYRDQIAILLGGIAAETVFFGDHSDGAGRHEKSDLGMATDLATVFERQTGLGLGLSIDLGKGRRPLEDMRNQDPFLRARVDNILRYQMERACGILRNHRPQLIELARKLVTLGKIDGEAVRELIDRSI